MIKSNHHLSLVKRDDVIKRAKAYYKQYNHIDIIKVCNAMGVNVNIDIDNQAYMKNASAYIAWNDKQAEIYVRSHEQKFRQRFSIAHELSHYILHKDKLIRLKHIDRNGDQSLDNELEAEADQLASEILMPEAIILEWLEPIKNQRLELEQIQDLAYKFRVSLTAMIVRLWSLDYKIPYIVLY